MLRQVFIGCVLEVSWESLVSWGSLGLSRGSLGALLGFLGVLLGSPGRLLGKIMQKSQVL